MSMLTYIYLQALNLPFECCAFKAGSVRIAFVMTEKALLLRRHLALTWNESALKRLTRAAPNDHTDFELKQTMLACAGTRVCPTSGMPVMRHIDNWSEDTKIRFYRLLVQAARAKSAGKVEAAVKGWRAPVTGHSTV